MILGTNAGDNSIGKSTFMLIIDFVFGGITYANSTDILNNIGSHDIYFTFIFNQQRYSFCRNNIESNTVWICDQDNKRIKSFSLTEYCSWLSKQYDLNLPYLSFRDLLKLFNKYSIIAEIEKQAEKSADALKAYNRAQALEFVSKIGVREYRKNEAEIKQLESEIQDISSGLEHDLQDVDAAASERAIYIKSELSRARRLRSNLCSKLSTIEENGEYHFSNTTDKYEDLRHIAEIESFHKKVSTIFKQELKDERKKLLEAIAEYDSIIRDYESELKELIQNPKLSKIVLQRYAEILKEIEKMRRDNESYIKFENLKKQKKLDVENLKNIKSEQLGVIEHLLNSEMERINDSLYKEEYYAPLIHFTDSGYSFTTPNDTGTGIAYKGLVVFDLAMLHLTKLPIVVHDSVVLKQISDGAIENIMNQYVDSGKQTVIALDKPRSYTTKTSNLLEKYSVLKLASNGGELFGRSWGKKW